MTVFTESIRVRHSKLRNITSNRAWHDSEKTFGEKQNKTTEQDNQRIYSILKQDEEYEKSSKRWWGYLKQLE